MTTTERSKNEYPDLTQDQLDAIVKVGNDVLLYDLHQERDWRHPGEFLTAYLERDPDFPIHQFQTGRQK